MVKPPKTMQPESVDLTKAGRKSGRAFQADSFHNYMARKIDLQRSQFGALLPPPPTTTYDTTVAAANDDNDNGIPLSPSRRTSPSRKRPRPTTQPKSVSFAMLELVKPEAKPEPESDNPHSMSTILKKLQQRHGRGSRLALRKHKKRKSRLHNDVEQIFPTENPLEREENLRLTVDCHGQSIQNEQEGAAVDDSHNPAHDSTSTSPYYSHAAHHTSIAPSDDNPTPPSATKIRRDRPDLFLYGVVVKVNGYTNPDNETIKRLVQKHGGDFETYETERVTHIIAERLSTAKAKFLKQQRRPRPVVSPTWILDCIQAARQLPHGDYLLPELKASEASQPGIKSLFAIESKIRESCKPLSTPTKVNDSIHDETCAKTLWDVPTGDDDVATKEDNACPNADHDASHDRPTIGMLTQVPEVSNNNERQHSNVQETSSNDDLETIAPTSPKPGTNTEKHHGVAKSCPSRQGASDGPIMDKTFSEDTHPKANGMPQPEKSLGRTDSKHINGKIRTVGTDPNFLESFFANSRLSFIGSYRQRTSNEKTSTASFPLPDTKSIDNCKRYVFHIDMDCFFANVVLRKYPQYRDKPVAISHHGKKYGDQPGGMEDLMVSEKSTSECATCNYHARQFGIKKGMFLGRARQLCPDLVVLQYDFAGYEEVSEQVLSILHRIAAEYHGCVEPVSCDEAYMELYLPCTVDPNDSFQTTTVNNNHAGDIAEFIRQEILETTECTASIGVAENKFLAKVGTDRVKPNGTFVVTDYREVLKSLRLRDLHGIGYRSEPKLSAEGLVTVQDVWDLGSKGEMVLSNILGPGLGKKIFSFCYGRDDRQVKPAERKTIGAECSYGVRFDGPYGIDHFMNGLANEVAKRMEGVGCKGCKMTLKLKQRKKDAKPPPKFLGHGSCHNLSKSMDMPDSIPTRDAAVLTEVGMTLFRELAVALDDVRGMGMVISKLCPDDGTNPTSNKGGVSTGGIATFFRNSAHTPSNLPIRTRSDLINFDSPGICEDDGSIQGHDETVKGSVHGTGSPVQDSNPREETVCDLSSPGMLALPPLSQICMSQVAALPFELQQEIQSRLADRNRDVFPGLDARESTLVHELDMDTESMIPSGTKGVDSFKTMVGHEKQGFRQTNLKRMMKLAAIKSGQGLEGVSLTQLQKLPLEIQLQITNEDADPVGLLSQKPRTTLNRPMKSRATFGSNGASAVKPKHGASVTIDVDDADDSEHDMLNEGTEPKQGEIDGEIENTGAISTDLFDDDIVPLQHFLDENSPLNSEAVDIVIDFLRTCLEERRMNVVPALIRSIKSRSDPWSAQSVLWDIGQGVDEHHFKMYNSRLDLQWLLRD